MGNSRGKIPAGMDRNLDQRDRTPLTDGMCLKFQSISMMPGIAKNFRYMIRNDGALFYAANSDEYPEDRRQIFNHGLPDEPTRMLPMGMLEKINDVLEAVGFFSQEPYQATSARDGTLNIVTARKGENIHEVWYLNVASPLIDFLTSISPVEEMEKTPEQELNDLKTMLADMDELKKRLSKQNNNSK